MGTHQCPGRCGSAVPRHHYACRNCWYRLPKPYRDEITRWYQKDDQKHAEAMVLANQWYGEQGTRDEKERHGADRLFERQRTEALQVDCEYCTQPAGKPCLDRYGYQLIRQAAHFVRITAAGKASATR